MMVLTLLAILSPWLNASQGIVRLQVTKDERLAAAVRSVVLAECNEKHQDGSDLVPPDTLFLVLWPAKVADDPLHLLWFSRVEDQDCRLPVFHWSSTQSDRAPPRLLA